MTDSSALFQEWLHSEGLKDSQAAAIFGVSKSEVNQWKMRALLPTSERRTQIALASSGFVPEDGWSKVTLSDERRERESPQKRVILNVSQGGMTLEEITQVEGVTRERVRQIIAIALTKLKKKHPQLMKVLMADLGVFPPAPPLPKHVPP